MSFGVVDNDYTKHIHSNVAITFKRLFWQQRPQRTHTHSRQFPPTIELVYKSTPSNRPATPICEDGKREANKITTLRLFCVPRFRLVLPSTAGHRNHRLTHLFVRTTQLHAAAVTIALLLFYTNCAFIHTEMLCRHRGSNTMENCDSQWENVYYVFKWNRHAQRRNHYRLAKSKEWNGSRIS